MSDNLTSLWRDVYDLREDIIDQMEIEMEYNGRTNVYLTLKDVVSDISNILRDWGDLV